MIPLERDRKKVPAQFVGAKLLALSQSLIRAQAAISARKSSKHVFDPSIWRLAKDQLLVETHGKCAYCETPLKVVSFGDVEHYRPSSRYWWLAYSYENYLASCAICNRSFKRDHFPVRNDELPEPSIPMSPTKSQVESIASSLVPDPHDPVSLDAFYDLHCQEFTLLVNPYLEDPGDYFRWRADEVIREVELIPISNDELSKECVMHAKEILGLDRIHLRRLRFDTFGLYMLSKETLEDQGISLAVRSLHEANVTRMTTARSPYAGMIRFFERIGTPKEWVKQGLLIR